MTDRAEGEARRVSVLAGGGYDRNLFTVRATWAEIWYVHENLVKRGLCEDPVEWPWMSAGAYRESGPEPSIPADFCPWTMDS